MATLFSGLALLCAVDAACMTIVASEPKLSVGQARCAASVAHIFLLCGALCLIAARYAA